MSGLTSDIENFLKELLEEASDGMVEIGRNNLASHFDCSPSQINYVLTTRFTPYKGYYIESKRGGNGFIKIMTITEESDDYIIHVLNNIKSQLSVFESENLLKDLNEKGYLTENEMRIMRYSISNNALKNVDSKRRNLVRSDILKNMLVSFVTRS
ncbi:MAG: CtsR family transcriptional regulator [Tissierellia bacterium]|nr:CtsR family transcriptional regulator [Tissierellia bacterium]